MTHSTEKQQSYYNEKQEREEYRNNRPTIIQQSFNNEKPIKHTNETWKWNTTMKNKIGTQQWHTAMESNNRTTMKTTMK